MPNQSLKNLVEEFLQTRDTNVLNQFFWSYTTPYTNDRLTNLGISLKHEDNYGGEGCGDDYWSVYSFSKDTEIVYVKFDGSYASYDGSTFDQWYFVEPRQVTVTKYFEV